MLPMLPEILLLMANWRPNMEKRRSQQRGRSTSAWPHQYAEGKSPETRSWARAPVWEGTRWPAAIWLVKCQIYLLIYHLLAFCAGSWPHSEKISRDAHRIQASSWQYSYEPQSAPFQWIYLVILQVAHRKVRRKTREQQQHVNEVERNKVIPESWIIYLKREEQNVCREHVQRSGWMPQFISLHFSRSTRQWEQGGPLAKFWQEEGFPHNHGKVLSLRGEAPHASLLQSGGSLRPEAFLLTVLWHPAIWPWHLQRKKGDSRSECARWSWELSAERCWWCSRALGSSWRPPCGTRWWTCSSSKSKKPRWKLLAKRIQAWNS